MGNQQFAEKNSWKIINHNLTILHNWILRIKSYQLIYAYIEKDNNELICDSYI